MATALPKSKSKGKVSLRLLLRNLEKSKINTRGQDQALRELSVCFLQHGHKSHEPGFKQCLSSTLRWYENNRRYFDENTVGLALLNEVFIEYGYSTKIPSRFKEEMDLLEKVRLLCNNNQNEEAMELLKTIEAKVKKAVETSDVWSADWVDGFYRSRGICFSNLNLYHLAIEDCTRYLARTAMHIDYANEKKEKMGVISSDNFKNMKNEMQEIQRERGFCYFKLGYYEEAKSDLKLLLKKLTFRIDGLLLRELDALCQSFLCLERYKHALHAVYKLRFCSKSKKPDFPISHSWFVSALLAKCLYKNKKFPEANWILSDLIVECQDYRIKVIALELNGHCLMEMNKYAEAMKNFNQAYELAKNQNESTLRIHLAMYRYAHDEKDTDATADLQYLILLWSVYIPVTLMEKENGIIETTSVKFVIEKSIQFMKRYKTEEAQNHLTFCNSVMMIKFFQK